MAYQVTAIKYRPQNFEQLIGQEFVASTLKNSIQNKRIANAYLLSGPRGIGKTSAARIIAKALNCINGPTGTPCNECENCISITNGYNSDAIEIDGASNTSINDIRVIQEEILYPPVNLKYKVYIIDEVHMLSKSAFNALLKTIEEPPKHVVFIFATTEINKVLPTIRSRCQQFNFRLIPSQLIYQSMVKILTETGAQFEEKAIKWIANEGNGSMRDAYTLMDQVVSFCNNEITMKKIQEKLGIAGKEQIEKIILGIARRDREKVFLEYLTLLEAGISPGEIISEMIKSFRNILFIKANLASNKLIGFNPEDYNNEMIDCFEFEDIENILEILFQTHEKIRYSIDVQTEIEFCLLKLIQYKDFIRPKAILEQIETLKKQLVGLSQSPLPEKKKIELPPLNEQPTAVPEKKKATPQPIALSPGKSEILKLIKSKVSPANFQLLTALNHIDLVEEKDKTIIFHFSRQIHYDLINNHLDFIIDEVKTSVNKDYTVKTVFDPELMKKKPKTIAQINKEKIAKIFNGQEIL